MPLASESSAHDDFVALFFEFFKLIADAQTLVESLMARLPRASDGEVRQAFERVNACMSALSLSSCAAKSLPVMLEDVQGLRGAAQTLFRLRHQSRLDYYANLGIDLLDLVCERLLRTTQSLMLLCAKAFAKSHPPSPPDE